MLAHSTKVVGAIANMFCDNPVFKSKLHGVIFRAFNNCFVLPGTYFFGFVYISFFELLQTAFQYGFFDILIKLVW